MKKIFQPAVLIGLLAIFGVPLFALAQGINLSVITPYSTSITSLINDILVPVLMAIAFIVFLWGVYKYFIQGAADEKSRADGRQFALWGIIGFVIILSLWGLVNLFTSMLGLTANNAPAFPTIGTGTSGVTNNSTGVTLPTSTVGGTTAGGTSAVQSQAYSALTNQYNSYLNTCANGNSTSAQCQSLYNAYMQANNAYIQQYGAVNSGAAGTGTGALGSSCTTNSQCSGSLVCQQNTCVNQIGSNGCAVGMVLDENGSCVSGTSSTGTQTNGTICDYSYAGSGDGTWQNGHCVYSSNSNSSSGSTCSQVSINACNGTYNYNNCTCTSADTGGGASNTCPSGASTDCVGGGGSYDESTCSCTYPDNNGTYNQSTGDEGTYY